MSDEKKCPECGEKTSYNEFESVMWEEGRVEKIKHCHNEGCDFGRKVLENYRNIVPEDKKRCRNCGSKFMPDESSSKFCGYCADNKILANVYPHKFGLLVPGETGVIYEQQTAGVMCSHVYIEGSYIPIRFPGDFWVENEEVEEFLEEYDVGLLGAVQKANYEGMDKEFIDLLWEEIRNSLEFDYELVDVSEIPLDRVPPQEGIKWIRITDVEEDSYSYDINLEGKIVCLVYPNCD